MGIFSIVTALLPFVTTELEQYKVISPNVGNLINGVEGAASVFASNITSSGSPSITAASFLAAVQAAVQVLQTQTTVSPQTLSIIAALDKAIQAGIAASNITSVDPTQIQPIAPMVSSVPVTPQA